MARDICGVKVDLLKEDVLKKALQQLLQSGALDPSFPLATAEDRVRAMQRYTESVRKNPTTRADIADCTNCGQPSDAGTLDVCPYCGEGDGDATVADPSTTTVLPAPGHGGVFDQHITKIKAFQVGQVVSGWSIGNELKAIEADGSWKERRTADGQVAYRTMEQACHAELNMSRRYMRELITICDRFSEHDVRLFGPTKIRVLMQLEEAEQQKLLDSARGTGVVPSRLELERMVPTQDGGERTGKHLQLGEGSGSKSADVQSDPVKGAKGKGRKGLGGAGKARKPEAAAPREGMVTIATMLGKQSCDLYKKPTSKQDPDDYERAKKIEDIPWGHIDLTNNVRIFIQIVRNPKGELRALWDVKRIAE